MPPCFVVDVWSKEYQGAKQALGDGRLTWALSYLRKSVEANDPEAMYYMGEALSHGLCPLLGSGLVLWRSHRSCQVAGACEWTERTRSGAVLETLFLGAKKLTDAAKQRYLKQVCGPASVWFAWTDQQSFPCQSAESGFGQGNDGRLFCSPRCSLLCACVLCDCAAGMALYALQFARAVPQDHANAAVWGAKAMATADPFACAVCWQHGLGVDRDEPRAVALYKVRAALLCSSSASRVCLPLLHRLCCTSRRSCDVVCVSSSALFWLIVRVKAAAEQDHSTAQHFLGNEQPDGQLCSSQSLSTNHKTRAVLSARHRCGQGRGCCGHLVGIRELFCFADDDGQVHQGLPSRPRAVVRANGAVPRVCAGRPRPRPQEGCHAVQEGRGPGTCGCSFSV